MSEATEDHDACLDERRRLLLVMLIALPPAAWAGYLGDHDFNKEYGPKNESGGREREYHLGGDREHDLVEHYREWERDFEKRHPEVYKSKLEPLERRATNNQYHLIPFDGNDPLDPYGLLDPSFEKMIMDFLLKSAEVAKTARDKAKLYLHYQRIKAALVYLLSRSIGGDTKALEKLMGQLARLNSKLNPLGKFTDPAEFAFRYFSEPIETRIEPGYETQILRDMYPTAADAYDWLDKNVFEPFTDWGARYVESASRELEGAVRRQDF